jgi:hypothetical protein
MNNRRRTLPLASLVPLLLVLGCDALTVRPFAGSVMQFTLANVDITQAGKHLELWTRDQYNDVIRVNPYYNLTDGKTQYGLMVRPAVSLSDPCMIDDQGNLLTTAAAYPAPISYNGVTQTPDQQAQQIVDRINQLTPPGALPLLAVLPYDPNTPSVPANAAAADRLAACNDYRGKSELTYVPNPSQITAPAHGVVYGFIKFVSVTPPVSYNGFRIDTPVNLKGTQEVFLTIENDTVDPRARGAAYVVSRPSPGGRDVLHFDLVHADPNGTASGAVAMYTTLDQDPVQF